MKWIRKKRLPRSEGSDDQWFTDHVRAAREVVDFCEGAGLSLEGLDVGDVGAGDGIIDLALALTASPASITGWDLNPVDEHALRLRAEQAGLCTSLPENLHFIQSSETALPASDDSMGAVVTWSAFEHIGDIEALAREISRVLKPGGFVFAQVWPLYCSERGSHLEMWWPEGFHHLTENDDVLRERLNADPGRDWADYMWGEYLTLNRATLDDVQACFAKANLIVRRCELYSHLVNIPDAAATRHRLSDLMIAGFKMILTPNAV
jgi:ubiquinone/menaquinone biosynthesis C-methylase UbiE